MRFLSFKYFESFEWVEINYYLFVMKIYFSLNSKRNEENKGLSQEIYNFQILKNETVSIADYKDMRISSYHLLVVKL